MLRGNTEGVTVGEGRECDLAWGLVYASKYVPEHAAGDRYETSLALAIQTLDKGTQRLPSVDDELVDAVIESAVRRVMSWVEKYPPSVFTPPKAGEYNDNTITKLSAEAMRVMVPRIAEDLRIMVREQRDERA